MKKFCAVFVTLVAFISVFLLGGCGGSSFSGTADLPDPLIRFVNGSMDSGSLNFYLNEDQRANDVAYTQSTLDFVSVPFIEDFDGAYDVYFAKSGTTLPLDNINRVLERDKAFLVLALGLVDPEGETDKRVRELILEVNRTKPVGNKAQFIVVHGFCRSFGNSTPSIVFQTPGDNPLFKTEPIAFGTATNLAVDAGKFVFEARRADATGTTIYASREFTSVSGGLYLVLISGVEDAPQVSQQPRIDFIQLSTKTN